MRRRENAMGMTMKRDVVTKPGNWAVLSLGAAALLLGGLLASPARAADDLSLNVDAGSVNVQPGDTVTVTLDIASISVPINGVQVLLNYDTTIMTLIDVAPTNLISAALISAPAAGWMEGGQSDVAGDIDWNAAITDGGGGGGWIQTDHTVATLTFTVIDVGTTTVAFRPDGTFETRLTVYSDLSTILPGSKTNSGTITSTCDDGNPCTVNNVVGELCDYTTPALSGTLCRASTDECDPQEVCDGAATTCPAEVFDPDGSACTDDGLLCTSDTCQTGVCSHPLEAFGFVCRASTDECDPEETCDGAATTCPAEVFDPDGSACTDDGLGCTSDTCQAGVCSHPLQALGFVCRASTDECDPEETCDGAATTCPVDALTADDTACTDDGLLCTSDTCQTGVCSHPLQALGFVCRASTDECDPEETCDGAATTCPIDDFTPNGSACTDDGQGCTNDFCQAGVCTHPLHVSGIVCRASTDECDPQEVCDGAATACPVNAFDPDGSACTDDGFLCTSDTCQTGACSHPVRASGFLCRASTDECDPEETCDGAATTCPGDTLLPNGTGCTDDGLGCTSDTCQAGVCSHLTQALGFVCRASTDECDPEETCDGSATTCPGDTLTPNDTVCTDDGLLCTSDTCQTGVCSHPTEALGFVCRASTDECDPEETCDGSATTCPGDTLTPDGTGCTDEGDACTVDECSTGVCTHTDNTPVGDCCDPGTGFLTTIDDLDPCTVDTCLPDGTVTHDPGGSVNVSLKAQALGSAVTRDVTFVITTCPGVTDTIIVPVSFSAVGIGSTVLPNVNAAATWIATSEGHTLRRLMPLSFTACSASVDMTGASWLLAGDFQTASVPQDNMCDIVDFSILAREWNAPLIDPNQSELADATGDGLQGMPDFTAIQINFFTVGDPLNGCARGEGGGGKAPGILPEGEPIARGPRPRARLKINDSGIRGIQHADLNGDGVVDTTDIRAFAEMHNLRLLPEFERKLTKLEKSRTGAQRGR